VTLERLSRFQQYLASRDLAGAVIRRPANVLYLTGYAAGFERPAFAVVGPDAVLVVGPGNGDGIQKSLVEGLGAIGYRAPGGTVDRVADVDALSSVALAEAVVRAGLRGKRVGVELGDVSARHAAAVGEVATVAAIDERLAAMRRIKDAEELALIRSAVAANDHGFGAVAMVLAAGVSEFKIQRELVDQMQKVVFVPIDVSGPNNAFISGPRTMLLAAGATDRRLEHGDLMIVDINPVIRNYKGDTTRTYAVGPPTSDQQKVHDTLVRGLESAEKLAKPGVTASAVARALQVALIAAGYGGLIVHGGHGIGLEHLERPYIILGDDMPLEEGMVITLEPGLYLPGTGGLRIEDNYLVTANGLEVLSHYPRELQVCW
jgi:Xaa-Pro aminopeptidase